MAVSVIIPAYNSVDTIGKTVSASRSIGSASEVIVVDDGSRDATAEAAREAGADQVVVLPRNRGKGAAMSAGVAAARSRTILFLDADLAESAGLAGSLVDAVGGRCAMSVAVFPRQPGVGGLGLARGIAAAAIRLLGGIEVMAPLSGQRVIPRELVEHLGLASRFGVETALTAEAALLGIPIVEVPLPLQHAHTGRTAAGFLHRARQLKDILRYALLAVYGLSWPALSSARTSGRIAVSLMAFAAIVASGAAIEPPAVTRIIIAALAGIIAWIPCLWISSVCLKLRKLNYLGRSVPGAAGLVLPIVAVPLMLLPGLAPDVRAAALVVVSVLGAVGLLDDLYASRHQARGLRGHLRALLSGRLTTGGVKAVGGLAAGVAAGAMLAPGRPGMIVLDALLIALCANSVNLLDLRPGRALKGFALLCAIALLASPDSLRLLGTMFALALVLAPAELAGRVMLGDVGANVLGGTAGIGLVIALSPWQRLVAALALLAFHVICERVSFSELVRNNRALAWLDALGTGHLPMLPTREAVP